ncbi:MAG: hypothetical protein ACLFU8_09660 [Anaerolineales bacterium]
MDVDLMLPRKWTLRSNGNKVVFIKHANERTAHVVMKALLWALYLPAYDDLGVEITIDDRYKPDVVALNLYGAPLFWGEAGQMSRSKLEDIARRYRDTHFALAKWGADLDALVAWVRKSLRRTRHDAPFDIISFPLDSAERFIDDRGFISITHADVDWVRI